MGMDNALAIRERIEFHAQRTSNRISLAIEYLDQVGEIDRALEILEEVKTLVREDAHYICQLQDMVNEAADALRGVTRERNNALREAASAQACAGNFWEQLEDARSTIQHLMDMTGRVEESATNRGYQQAVEDIRALFEQMDVREEWILEHLGEGE